MANASAVKNLQRLNSNRYKTIKQNRFVLIVMRKVVSLMASSNKKLVPEAKEALEKFKMEAANEVGVNIKQGYNGDLTSKQAGSVGGQMVKKMVEKYENDLKNNK